MARPIANIEVSTDTFAMWVLRTNALAEAHSTETLTANATVGVTGNTASPRNSELIGMFSANTLAAMTELRGGNTSTVANLNVTSNVVISPVTFTSAANSTFSNTAFFTANVSATGALVNIAGTTLNVSSNTTVTAANISLKSNSSVTALGIVGGVTTVTTIGGNSLALNANLQSTGVLNTIAGNTNFSVNTLFVDSVNKRVGIGTSTPSVPLQVIGASNISGATAIGGTLNVTGAATVSNTLATGNTTITGFETISGTLTVNGATAINNALASGNTTITGFANVSGNATIGGNVSATGSMETANDLTVAGKSTFGGNHVLDVATNLNIGTNAAPRLVYSFPASSYKSGKLLVQATNGANVQTSEMVVAHNGTTPYLTVYGVVASPPGAGTSAPLGTFSVDINSGNIVILMDQVISGSSVTVVAQLIK